MSQINRRQFLATTSLGALAAACPFGTAATIAASTAPELKVGLWRRGTLTAVNARRLSRGDNALANTGARLKVSGIRGDASRWQSVHCDVAFAAAPARPVHEWSWHHSSGSSAPSSLRVPLDHGRLDLRLTLRRMGESVGTMIPLLLHVGAASGLAKLLAGTYAVVLPDEPSARWSTCELSEGPKPHCVRIAGAHLIFTISPA